MSNLKHWQDKIKEKKSKTDFRDFLKEIVSWCPSNLQKVNGVISRYPDTNRIKNTINSKRFEENRDKLIEKGINYDFNINLF